MEKDVFDVVFFTLLSRQGTGLLQPKRHTVIIYVNISCKIKVSNNYFVEYEPLESKQSV